MSIKTKILSIIFRPFVFMKYHKSVDKEQLASKILYPQGWYFMPRNKIIRSFLQTLCKIVGGHELSETEWGYGGGEYADRWCRWCDKMIQVPKTSVYFTNSESRELMKFVGKEFKE